MTEDPKLSGRYRELPREEPPRRLDEAILAASRRAAESRPAPLVAPTGRRRWYFPVAAAAIIVLAVAVTVHVERQQRIEEVAEAPLATPAPPAVLEKQEQKDSRRDDARLNDLYKAPPAPEAPTPPAAAPSRVPPAEVAREQEAVRAELARAQEEAQAKASAGARSTAERRTAAERVAAAAAVRSPEQWLQGIVDLRRQGRHDEADKQLAEFRKRYPDYRIPAALLEKIEKR